MEEKKRKAEGAIREVEAANRTALSRKQEKIAKEREEELAIVRYN